MAAVGDSKNTLREDLGMGRFGPVYKTQMQGRDVVVKKITLEMPNSVKEAFIQEAEAHKTYNSPQIVQLLNFDTLSEYYALILEYLPNGSLYDALHTSKKELPWETCEQIAIDCGEGLSYLHSNDICHRDLKSTNVLLDAQMRAKLSDFGQAALKTHKQTTTGTSNQGTVRWRAPETFQKEYKYAPSADVYSLGVVMWELVSKALPFAKEQNETNIMQHIKVGGTEKIPDTCPSEYGELLNKAWQKDPSARLVAGEIVDQLTQQRDYKKGEWLFMLGRHDEARLCLDRATKAGHPFAYFMLLFLNNNTMWSSIKEEDYGEYKHMLKERIDQIKRFAEEGNARAQCTFGECINRGLAEGEGSSSLSMDWFKYAADKGDPRAQWLLGELYSRNDNDEEMVRYYKLAADQKYPSGQTFLAACYKMGDGVEKDQRKAMELYALAARQGSISARHDLAQLAYKLTTNNDPYGLLYYGECLEHGFGTEKNEAEALKLYALAVQDRELSEAKERGALLAKKLFTCQM